MNSTVEPSFKIVFFLKSTYKSSKQCLRFTKKKLSLGNTRHASQTQPKHEFGYQCLGFWLGPMPLFTIQPKTQKYVYQCIFESHGTIYTFKNYFATVFSAINF